MNLIFIAAATDDVIRAIDIESGEVLWRDTLPAGGQATPIIYSVDGRQYLTLMAGGHHFMETAIGDHVITWALPETRYTFGDGSSIWERKHYVDVKNPDGRYYVVVHVSDVGKNNLSLCYEDYVTIFGDMYDDMYTTPVLGGGR